MSDKISDCLENLCVVKIDYYEKIERVFFPTTLHITLTDESVKAINDLKRQADEIKKTKAKAFSFDKLKKAFRASFEKMLELI